MIEKVKKHKNTCDVPHRQHGQERHKNVESHLERLELELLAQKFTPGDSSFCLKRVSNVARNL